MTIRELGPDSVATLSFELNMRNQRGPIDLETLENELLELEGYLESSAEVDQGRQLLQLKVVRGTPAETNAKFALLRARISFRQTSMR